MAILTNSITTVEGNDVSVYCQVRGYPLPVVVLSTYEINRKTWKNLPQQDFLKSKLNDTITNSITWEFELKNIKGEQSREYRCAASNSEGSSYSDTISIHVYGKL